MAFNTRKVVTGGVLAGAVLVVVSILAQLALVDRARSEMNSWVPGSADRIGTSVGVVAAGVAMKLIIGMTLVWLYAAIRPRFGPGVRTACYAAIPVWILGAIFFSDFPMMGMMSGATYAMLEFFQLVGLLIAAWIGTRTYSE